MLKLRTRKTTRQEIENMGHANPICNLMHTRVNVHGMHFNFCDGDCGGICSRRIDKKIVQKYKPVNTMPDYESNPGVWILDDAESEAYFIIYSDCHRKNAHKGTQTCIGPRNLTDSEASSALAGLLTFLNNI